MSFATDTLKQAIKDAFNTAQQNSSSAEAAQDALAEAISDAIAVQVKACIDGATVTNNVLYVLSNGAGPVTGTIEVTTEITSQIS